MPAEDAVDLLTNRCIGFYPGVLLYLEFREYPLKNHFIPLGGMRQRFGLPSFYGSITKLPVFPDGVNPVAGQAEEGIENPGAQCAMKIYRVIVPAGLL